MRYGPYKTEGHCTFCGSKDDVLCYPSPLADHARYQNTEKWPSAENDPTACPDCCGMQEDGHEFTYDRSDWQWTCGRCGAFPPDDFFDDMGDDRW